MARPEVRRMIIPNKIAMEKFAKTPAAATAIVPHFLLLKLSGLYGTGFAQPNKKGVFEMTRIAGKSTEPNKSKCLSGLSVRRPA